MRRVTLLLLAIATMACSASSAPTPEQRTNPEPIAAQSQKRIVVGITGDPQSLSTKINAPAVAPSGSDVVEQLVSAGLTVPDDHGGLRPQLAEQVPTTENGDWALFSDGRMSLTWRIRADAVWHDGAPITSDDLLFTVRVGQDRDLTVFNDVVYGLIESVEAPDAQTLVVNWKSPYIDADTMFTYLRALPLPRHLLERAYDGDKPSFAQLPYWTDEFVGSGAFKLREWVKGSRVVLAANERYPLGRPRIDEIEVRFITDAQALTASLLAGTVDVTLGRNLSLEQAVQVRDQWQAGRMEYTLQSWVVIFPQFVDPSPAIVAEVPFRRALLHAIDRQQMADTLLRGLVPIAHSVLNPNEPEYIAVEREIVRYDYDPRRAAQLIEGLGYAKGSDGVYRDAAGQRLEFEVRTSTNDLQIKAQAAAADAWRRLGVEVEPAVIPQERQVDTEYAASFSGFQLFRQPDGVNALNRYYGSKAALPANSFRATGNHARYVNPEFDALLDSYYTTVPWQPRLQALGRVVHHMTDELIAMGLFYDAEPNLIANRLREVGVRYGGRATQTWNAHLWDVQGGGA